MTAETTWVERIARRRPGEIFPVWPRELSELQREPEWWLFMRWRDGMGRGYIGSIFGVDVFDMQQ